MSICSKKIITALVSASLLSFIATSVFAAPAKTVSKRPRPVQSRPAAAPAKVGGNTVVSSNPALNAAYNNYLNCLRQKIDNKWYLADGNNHVTMSMSVASDGSVTELEISSSPKNTQAEQAASDAFNQCQPLSALPSGSNSVKLTLNFDSNADPHGDNDRHITAKIEAAGSSASSSSSQSNSSNGTTSSQSNSSASGDSSSSSSSSSSSPQSDPSAK